MSNFQRKIYDVYEFCFHVCFVNGKGKVVPVLNELSTTP
jgi:hypothetical protein